MDVSIKILENGKGLEVPRYATVGSAGLDLRAAITDSVVLHPNQIVTIPTGLAIMIPSGFEGQVRPRSGLACNFGITVLNSPGTVDCDFRGELKVLLVNFGTKDFIVERGFRIAQLVISKYEKVTVNIVDSLDNTERADGGYGSTGIN